MIYSLALQSKHANLHKQLRHLCSPFGDCVGGSTVRCRTLYRKGNDMKIVRALILTTLIASTFLVMFICGAAIAGYAAPEFAFVLLPYVGMVIIIGIWYPY